MISASEIHELRFEKAAFGYKQEDIDDFLNKLEKEVELAQQELSDSNNKIQVLADRVRDYMRDEDAVKDALLGAQKEGHRIVSEANERADEIVANAKERAEAMMQEVTVQHDALIEKNEAEIAAARQNLENIKKQTADFKKTLFDMYKEHISMISAIPDETDDTFGMDIDADIDTLSDELADDDLAETTTFSAKTIQGAYDSHFGDLEDNTEETPQ